MYPHTLRDGPIGAWRRPIAAALLLSALTACGGGGSSSPTASMPAEPATPVDPGPSVPTVAGTVTAPNDAAIDPTLAFRAVQQPQAAGFEVTVTAPDSPVIVWNRHDGPRADLAPDDLDAMARRAGHLWTRRLTDGGTFPIELYVGFPQAEQCGDNRAACAGCPGFSSFTPNAVISLPDRFLELSGTHDDKMTVADAKVVVHEVGHALSYRDPATNGGHAACATGSEQVMCGRHTSNRPIAPTEADFAGLVDGYTRNWTVSPAASATDHQDFGMWAAVPGAAGLDGLGINVRRTLAVDDGVSTRRPATEALTDTIAIHAEVRGTATAGPAGGLGTATWSGIFLGADSHRFEPVTGDATLTADLADLETMDLALSGLARTDAAGQAHPLAAIGYDLERHGSTWIDGAGRADARFYEAGSDPAGAAAGIVSDAGRDLVGAWGGRRD